MRNQHQTRPGHTGPPGLERRKTVVIADDGGEASVVVFDASHKAETGSEFDHAGRRWVIRGQRRHSRVFVAEPLGGMRQ